MLAAVLLDPDHDVAHDPRRKLYELILVSASEVVENAAFNPGDERLPLVPAERNPVTIRIN